MRRIYDKKHACYYCGHLYCKIARHYELKHKTEREVAITLSFNKGSATRKKYIEKLRSLGDYHHNLTVVETGEGELIIKRRPSLDEKCNADDFLPCNRCLVFIKRMDLWKHIKSCKFKSADGGGPKYQKVQQKAKLLLQPQNSSNDNSTILETLFLNMKKDEVTLIAKNDWLIMEIGLFLVEKHGQNQHHLISQKMRELSRFLIELRSSDLHPNDQLSDFIKPAKFDVVVTAVKNLSKFQFQDGAQRVATPSLSLKIGHSLKKCVTIIRDKAFHRGDKDLQEDADNSEKLLESE